jgi:hypothetical protein
MAPIFSFVLLCVVGWLDFLSIRSLARRKAARAWFVVLGLCLALGMLLGFWPGFYFEYHLTEEVRVAGFPVPGAFFVLESYEDGSQQWVDFIVPATWFVALSNAILLPLYMPILIWLVYTLQSCCRPDLEE